MSSQDTSSFNISIDPASPSADEYFKSIEDRVNRKIADSMKKAVALILTKFEKMLQEWVQLMITEEIDKKIKNLSNFKNTMEAHADNNKVVKTLRSPRTHLKNLTSTPES